MVASMMLTTTYDYTRITQKSLRFVSRSALQVRYELIPHMEAVAWEDHNRAKARTLA